MNCTKLDILSRLQECHDELKSHPFRLTFEKQYIGDYKFLLYHLTEIWCDLIYRCTDIPEKESKKLKQFGYWIHDYRQHLRSWDSKSFPMSLFDYYEQMLQITHEYLDTGNYSYFYNIDVYFDRTGRHYVPTRYEWITSDNLEVDSEILPRYMAIGARYIVSENEMKIHFLSGFDTEGKQHEKYMYWMVHTKPVLECLNSKNIVIEFSHPVWKSAICSKSPLND